MGLQAVQALKDLVFEGAEQIVFILVVVVERAAIEVGLRAEIVDGEPVEPTFVHKRDQGIAQRRLGACDAPILGVRRARRHSPTAFRIPSNLLDKVTNFEHRV